MAGIYLYAIADSPLGVRTRGMFGRRLRSIDVGGVHAIVERAERAPRATIARLRAQDRVLRELSGGHAALLPARFGAFSTTRRELESALAARRAHLKRALRHVRGCVQMTLRLFPAARAVREAPSRKSGAAYLRQIASAARARAAHPDLRRVQRASRGFVKGERVEWHDGPALVASIYHLVPRARQQEYLGAMAAVARSKGLKLLVSGPWLPFAFAEDVA